MYIYLFLTFIQIDIEKKVYRSAYFVLPICCESTNANVAE